MDNSNRYDFVDRPEFPFYMLSHSLYRSEKIGLWFNPNDGNWIVIDIRHSYPFFNKANELFR